ncbi:MAG: PEP/pyruvate-binding domain-containing protein [Thermogemmata sp.]|nr:PEP/pyruvate-binding domain-containing protein [Thermogemmata sp.]
MSEWIVGLESPVAVEVSVSGGKGASLAALWQAGLPVPEAFIITTAAYRWLHLHGIRSDPRFLDRLRQAYEQLGRGPVAVRSSATAEDAAEASFAGQQETILGVEGEAALVEAIERCWQSLQGERAVAYRARQGVDEGHLAMAVVVQRLIDADSAGVLFTRHPFDPQGRTMLVEASWGLGETVVAGRVQPDRYVLDRDSGQVRERHLGLKAIRRTPRGEEHVAPELQQRFCLDESVLSQLVSLGRQVEQYYGAPRDVEWAWAAGRLYLLQARPITTADAAQRERWRQEEIARLRQLAAPGGTVWVRYNLSEVLPAPTPMTWSVVSRLLAADGGFGAMNRSLGAEPDPALGSLSAFDLVAGRPMLNLSRLPRMQSARPLFDYPFEEYRQHPERALEPKPRLQPLAAYGCLGGVLRLPILLWRLGRQRAAVQRQMADYPQRMTERIRSFTQQCRQALEQDWSTLSPEQLLRKLHEWIEQTLVVFASESLKATVFADTLWNELTLRLAPHLGGVEAARAAVGRLALGARPPLDADLAEALRQLQAGQISRTQFLERFGHRGPHEMELSQPRWRDQPALLDRLVHVSAAPSLCPAPSNSDASAVSAVSSVSAASALTDEETVWQQLRVSGPWRDRCRQLAQQLRLFLGWRETGKHYLMLGYAVIRRILLELDRHYGLHGGIFYLTLDELPRLLAGENLRSLIAANRLRYQTLLSLEVPPVLFSDDLEAIGRPAPPPPGADLFQGVPLSAGVAEGPALVLTEPTAAPPGQTGYILVCPSTDPAWVPLFAHAKGLIMETGGVLSHGAIVAREFGLPAVAGLPHITRQIRTGDSLRLDGGTGQVARLSTIAAHDGR